MVPGIRLIEWAAKLVPYPRRAAWKREWEAEVTYAWKRLHRDGTPGLGAVLRLRLRVLACLIDALWEMKETMTMTGFLNELRFAFRSLVKYPTFTVIAVLTLALGIGANTAVFTLVDGVLLSPLPFEDSGELVALEHQGRDGQDELPMSPGLYVLYQERAATLSGVALHASAAINLVSEGEPIRMRIEYVTPPFFEVLEVGAAVGRTFTTDEGEAEGPNVVILSDGLWEERFASSPEVIGQTIDLNGTLHEVVGVMPADFGHPNRDARMWLPMQIDPLQAPLANFGASGFGRLAPGQSVESLDQELRGLISRLAEFYPDSGAPAFLEQVGLSPVITPLKQAIVGDMDRTLWILLGTVGFVLLIACANVANLLLVRAEGRQRELALRVAMGAGKLQVLRSFMSESVVLALGGGLLGVLIAAVSVETTLGLVPANLPRIDEVALDGRVLGFSASLAIACALFFGLFPLMRYGTEDLAGQLREGGARGATGGGESHRLRNTLVVVQMALALVLLVGSGLMIRSFQALQDMDPGFDAEGALTARITIPTAEIENSAEVTAFFRTLRDRLEGQSGVESVGLSQSVPLGAGLGFWGFPVEDHPRAQGDIPIFARHNQVTEGYLEAMGIDLVEGRTFERGDAADGFRAVVINQSFADRWWPEGNALGRRMSQGFQGEDWYEVVGVVQDAHYSSLEEAPEGMVYWPSTVGPADDPQPARSMDVTIRTSVDPTLLVPVLRREVAALNPRIPVSNPRAMEDLVSAATSRTSFTMALLGAASGVALLLGLIGIYGVISYVVSQRTREIGVRMALGATAPSVRQMVIRQGLQLAGMGVAIGLLAAGALSRVMASLLYGVSALDPITYGGVAIALVVVSLVASWIPAARAARVDPSLALRAE